MEITEAHKIDFGGRQIVGWILGPLFLLLTLFLPAPEGLGEAGWRTLGVAALMATWWICEPIPIPVTSLLPMVLFPLLHIFNIGDTTAPYANPIIYLFLGGFLIALAMERWKLHLRIALNLISVVGTKPSRIVGGFMIATAAVSMWVSNTATALMMLPIALSIANLVEAEAHDEKSRGEAKTFSLVLLLSVAYSATIGALGTIISTPPSVMLAAFVSQTYGFQIGFAQWMMIGMPIVIVGIPIAWLLFTRVIFKVSSIEVAKVAESIAEERRQLGPLSKAERRVATIFVMAALAWIFQPFLARFVPLISDTGIALMAGILLFITPVDLRRGEFLMNWQTAKKLPWDVFLLFGGGLSLAAAIGEHGVATWISTIFDAAGGVPTFLLIAMISAFILIVTELNSNTATAATFLPIIGAVAVSVGENPLLFLIPTAMAANCTFMLPVGTPPNAIVFGSGKIPLPQMARAGVWFNLTFLVLIVVMVYVLAPLVFGIEKGVLPDFTKGL